MNDRTSRLLLSLPPILLLLGPLLGGRSLVPFGAARSEVMGRVDAVHWDAIQQDTPWKIAAQRAYEAGRIPLWDFGAFCGAPLLANNQSAPLYPGNALYLFLPAEHALAPTLLLHLILAAWGAQALVRGLGGSASAGLLGGFSLSLSGTMLAFLVHPQMTATLALAPWVLELSRRTLAAPGLTRVAGLAGLVGLQLLAGHLQYAIFTWIVAGAMILFLAGRRAAAVIAFGLGGLLGAPQVLPTLEYAVSAARKPLARTESHLVGRYQHSLPLSQLPTLAWPESRGPEAGPSIASVNFRMYCLTIGLVPLALLLGGVGDTRAHRLFVSLALLGLLLALGTPLTGLFTSLPGFASLKPARSIALFTLAGSIAAGMALDRPRRRGVALAALLMGLALVAPGRSATPGLWPAVLPSLLRVCAGLGVMAIALTVGRRRPATASRVAPGLALLGGLELTLFAAGVVPTWPRTPTYELTPELEATAGSRFSSPVFTEAIPNTAMALGLQDARGTDSFIPRRYHELIRSIDPTADDMVRAPLRTGLRLPVHALLASHLLRVDDGRARRLGLRRVAGVSGAWTDPRSPALAYVPSQVRPASDPAAALEAVLSPDFDPKSAVVEDGDPDPLAPGRVTRYAVSPNRIHLEVEAEGPSTVVVLHGYHAGWSPNLDGVRLFPANAAFIGLSVPGGASRFDLLFHPISFRLGLFLGLVALTATVGLRAAGHRRPREAMRGGRGASLSGPARL